jgi:hypothetical protein
LPVEYPLPGAKVEPAIGDGGHDLAPHDLPLEVGTGVVPSVPSGQSSPVRLWRRWLVGGWGTSSSRHFS